MKMISCHTALSPPPAITGSSFSAKFDDLCHADAFRHMAEASPCGIGIVAGSDWRVKWLNPACRALLQADYQDKNVVGRVLPELITDFTVNGLATALRQAAASGSPVHLPEYRHPHGQTGATYWNVTFQVLPTMGGTQPDLMFQFAEVTDSVRAREKSEAHLHIARQHEQLFNNIPSSSPDCCYVLDLSGNFIYANTAMLDMLQQTAENLMGKRLCEIAFPAELALEFMRQIESVVFTGKCIKGEFPFTLPGGPAGFYEYILAPVTNADGKVEAVVGCTREITEGKHLATELLAVNERLVLLFNGVAAGLIVHDKDGNFMEINAAAERILGISTQKIKGKHDLSEYFDTVREDGSPFPWGQHPAMIALQTGQSQRNVVMGVNRPGAPRMWISINVEPIRDEHGTVCQAACSFIDITERKHTEDALQQSHLQLRRLAEHQLSIKENERKRIARDIHDELGQNLLVLKIHVSILHEQTASDNPALHREIGTLLNQINGSINSVRTIMNNLRPPMLDELGLYAALQWQLRQFESASCIPCILVADEEDFDTGLDSDLASTLYRIIQESLANIARHAKASRVEVSLFRDRTHLYLTVCDNGIGMRQGDRKKRNSFGLLGIEERIHSLGGKFLVRTSPGAGTMLSIFIPHAENEALYL